MNASKGDTLTHVPGFLAVTGVPCVTGFLWGLAVLLFAGIVVAWSPEFWAPCIVEMGAFTLCAICIARAWMRDEPLALGLVPILLATVVAWGCMQLVAGFTVDRFETRRAVLYWSANLAIFVSAASLLRGARERAWFRNALLWFGCAVNLFAIAQVYAETFGPFVYRNQYAAFIELLFPMALYRAWRDRRGSLLYICV